MDIHPDHYQFLGFQWEDKGELCYYLFAVIPFGLCTAPYLFTNLMRPLIKLWRGKVLKAIIYLDDGIVSIKGEHQARVASVLVISRTWRMQACYQYREKLLGAFPYYRLAWF